MIEEGESVVIGVSGGADSMCLLHMLTEIREQYKLHLIVIHIHHGIRKETADRDAAFVEEYCLAKDIQCVVKRVNVPELSKEWGMSEEEAGRKVRYEAFSQHLMGKGKIAVAHNADDQAETVLLNLFRGSGIKGMSGIQPVRGNIIRPVLCLTRQEIEEYNRLNDVKYIEDETNFLTDYTRNKLRLNILPAIKESINQKASEHIVMAGSSLAQIDDYMEKQCDEVFKQCVEKNGDHGLYILKKDFFGLHVAMKQQLMKRCLYVVAGRAKDITGVHINSAVALFDLPVGRKIDLPYEMECYRDYEGVCVRIKQHMHQALLEGNNEIIEIEETDKRYVLKCGEKNVELTVSRDVYHERIFEENKYTKWIAYDIINGNLQLRTRRDGDYIIIDEKGSRKKLKDYFIDNKIPREERNGICLVTRGSEVIWIVGYRMNSAYKIKENTGSILRLDVSIYDGLREN